MLHVFSTNPVKLTVHKPKAPNLLYLNRRTPLKKSSCDFVKPHHLGSHHRLHAPQDTQIIHLFVASQSQHMVLNSN